MATDRSDKAYDYWRDASLRFDYFVTGLTGALTAYVGQTIKPHRIGLNPESLELLALLLLVGSVVAGLKHIESGVEAFRAMHSRLYHYELRGALVEAATKSGVLFNRATGDMVDQRAAAYEAQLHGEAAQKVESNLEKIGKASVRYYKLRNRLLFVGFLLLVAGRILPAYVGQ